MRIVEGEEKEDRGSGDAGGDVELAGGGGGWGGDGDGGARVEDESWARLLVYELHRFAFSSSREMEGELVIKSKSCPEK